LRTGPKTHQLTNIRVEATCVVPRNCAINKMVTLPKMSCFDVGTKTIQIQWPFPSTKLGLDRAEDDLKRQHQRQLET
jgi:hypothetical protein